jgi:pyruvate ferredoxin oxidoreductase gamma subunit
MDNPRELLEIVFFARGGQGAKSAAEILAEGAVQEGKFVQAFPSFGPERSGAPTETYLRISNQEIRTHEPVINPDIIVVLDETLLKTEKKSAKIWIINSARGASELKDKFQLSGEIYPIDANGISLEIVGAVRPNTVILGKLVKIIKMVKIESVVEEFRKIFENKICKDACDKNIEAIKKAYDINNQ